MCIASFFFSLTFREPPRVSQSRSRSVVSSFHIFELVRGRKIHASTEQAWDSKTQVEVENSRHELTRDVARLEKLLLTKKKLLSQLPAPLTWKEPDDGAKEFEALEDVFFQTLKKDVNEISFTRMLLSTSAPPVNGMHIFNWNTLSASNCFYDAGKSLYEEYKKQRGDSACMSTQMFASKLKEAGLMKAQKRLKIGKNQAEVVWVGFKRKRGE